ncbi:NXPE family member 2-like [Pecten maximus]|uniref:NXPE family member 2-like n=1 Tax=Pecten maximus TaxID=6579 RepID=UPI001458A956|nr:NXPE family member 2-like [Pecten maximus]XP_033761019.1 NXPE family member 2-like [Pecten maximus]
MEGSQKKRKRLFVLTPYQIILACIGTVFLTWNVILYRTKMTVTREPQAKDYVSDESRKVNTWITQGSNQYFFETDKTSRSIINPAKVNSSSSRSSNVGKPPLESNSEEYISKKDLMKILDEFIRKRDKYRKITEQSELIPDKSKPKENDSSNFSARARRSLFQVQNPSKNFFRVGEKFRLTIFMKDKLGRNITLGGDFLRMWMKETSVNAHVSGVVTDNGDGTYSGEVLLPWAGQPTIHVALSHTKNDVNSVTNAINNYGILNKMYAQFVSKDRLVQESVPCGPLPVFSLRKENMCNLTRLNYGYYWYSAKPSSPKLSCGDWVAIRGTNNLTVPGQIADRIRYTQHQPIGEPIQITVIGKPGYVLKRKPNLCSRRPRENTWREPSPSGFNYQDKWTITGCQSNLTKTVRNYHKCLTGRHLMIMGDSNTRSFVHIFVSMLQMFYLTKPMPGGSWHDFVYAENQYNNSLSWYPHGSPFFANFLVPKYKLQPVSKHLDEVGSGNNSVIIIHLWGHFMRIPYDVFRLHVRKIRVSVEKLLLRSPDVDIVIKGPHAMTYFDWITPVDAIWLEHKRIWFEEFNGLHDKVLFINYWDMTVGIENIDIHPEETVIWSQVHLLMQLLCRNSYK